mmetsp:Transcript_1677/g.3849  ORF Transcript_1677/g.3849 Transcript_1677/m.3849 type:complete len:297 (-) Transcript_1677:802-1692(-)
MTSSIFRIILTTCVASIICCFFPMRVSKTFCFFMSLVPSSLQSIPRRLFFSATCCALTAVRLSMGASPEFSASASGMASSASAKARIAYCSTPFTSSAAASTASEQAISADPPPYTIELSLTRFLATHRASCRDRLVSSRIIRLPPLTKIVTALLFAQSSITIMLSLVVPKLTSFTLPALPSLSSLSSTKRGTMRPPVAIAINSISTPPTHLTAGRSFLYSRWLASSSKPHWQMIKFAPESLHCWIMSVKYFCSVSCSFSYFSTVSMSTLCLVFGLGGSKGHVRMAILASSMFFGI